MDWMRESWENQVLYVQIVYLLTLKILEIVAMNNLLWLRDNLEPTKDELEGFFSLICILVFAGLISIIILYMKRK